MRASSCRPTAVIASTSTSIETNPGSPCSAAARRSTRSAAWCAWTRAARSWSTGNSPNTWPRRPGRTSSTAGARRAIASGATGGRATMCRPTWPGTRISTATASGRTTRATGRCGSRRVSPPAGRPIATAIGATCVPGAGPGSTTRAGATRHSTTGAGCTCATAGHGVRDSASRVRHGRPHWSHGLAAPISRLASPDPRSGGIRSRRGSATSRGTRRRGRTSIAST